MFISINAIIHTLYVYLTKPVFFLNDPEVIHDRVTAFGAFLGRFALTRWITAAMFSYQHPMLSQTIHGITFRNPVGLSAGFDKNGKLVDILPSVGFGFMEIGSVTGTPCEGNPKPRLWRLTHARSLQVNYGLMSDGAQAMKKRLEQRVFAIPLGINIAKANSRATAQTKDGIADYMRAYTAMISIADYITVNLSCPNAYGGQSFQDPRLLTELLNAIDAHGRQKPIFLKISPDISEKQLDDIIDVALRYHVEGIICSNLTKSPHTLAEVTDPLHEGGVSGKLQEPLSIVQIRTVYRKTKGRITIIGVGGIFNAEDAYTKIKAGASLVELITGMIFEGPQLIGRINYDLTRLLQRDGYTHISQAVGVNAVKR